MDDLTRFRLRNVISCIIESVVKKGDEVSGDSILLTGRQLVNNLSHALLHSLLQISLYGTIWRGGAESCGSFVDCTDIPNVV